MIQRYFNEPYRFVPPYRSQRWCRIARHIMPRYLARTMRVTRWQFLGAEKLVQSVKDGAGIVLASNHCRWPDPVVLSVLGIERKLYFYYLVSYHLLKQRKMMDWWLNRIGAYSVWREGADRESIRSTAQLLATADRPIVVFPEGTWFRQNDRLGPLQDGLTLMFRQAAKQSDRPLRVHPVAIKYWHLDDCRPTLRQRLDKLETRLGWKPQHDLELVPRIEKLGSALLALKEIEYLGEPQCASLDQRIAQLANAIVASVEKIYQGHETTGPVLERIRRLRQRLVKKLNEPGENGTEAAIRQTLDALLFSENLSSHSHEYLLDSPSLERMSETVMRIEETVYDVTEVPAGDVGAVVEVGESIDARAFQGQRTSRDGGEPMMEELAKSLQDLLDGLNRHGPPVDWNCPKTMTTPVASASHCQPSKVSPA